MLSSTSTRTWCTSQTDFRDCSMALFWYMTFSLKTDSCHSSSFVFVVVVFVSLHDEQKILTPLPRLGFALSDVRSLIMELCQVLMHQEQIQSDSSIFTAPVVAAC